RLQHDLHRLADLGQAYKVAVVAVAVLAYRDIEIEPVVDAVGLVLAQVKLQAGATQHGAGSAVVNRVFNRQAPDVARTSNEDLVVRKQLVQVVRADERLLADPTHAVGEVGRDIPGHAAGAEVGVHEAV